MLNMKTPGAVLLLLWSGLVVVAAESGGRLDEATGAAPSCPQHNSPSEVHVLLREMAALIAGQRVDFRLAKAQIEELKKENGDMNYSLQQLKNVTEEAMETRLTERLAASEKKAEGMETRLRASEKTVEEQRAVIKELKEKQEEQAAAVRAVGGSVNLTGSQVQELRSEIEERKVSFSASLGTSEHVTKGPVNTAIPLVYKHIFTNIGNAYNPNTGVFTAPVRGVYHFNVFVFADGNGRTSAVSLHKNGEHICVAYTAQNTVHMAASNGASLLLEVGDVVNLKLWQNTWVRDTSNHHTTFSGHLLFPM
ncbi:complement C1q-like protein 2 isoform X2 [Clupea harengus]|uniref:Complement C1q-like protein 2 isoform X2 n=1 Tax=Clupea harengus TaxID=7950 RepID=A0A6P8GCG9_CLUHA|nr:complement C1q-like protein 2 isoform X2 [Clupea harengus]